MQQPRAPEQDDAAPVLTSADAGVATITLNRPERHNSLVLPLLDGLVAAVDDAEAQADVRAIVLTANGPSFSTGGDLGGFLDNASRIEDYAAELVGRLNDAITRLIESPLPVIVAVDGQVTGGSLGLVLAGDIVLVTERASFTPYYSVVGFSPDGGWTALLPDIIGRTRVSAVLAENRTITARQAHEWGIANNLADGDSLEDAVQAIIARVLDGNSESLTSSKRLLVPRDYVDRLEAERRQFVERVGSADALAGVRAFVERGRDDGSQ